jgi:hypothetical protein
VEEERGSEREVRRKIVAVGVAYRMLVAEVAGWERIHRRIPEVGDHRGTHSIRMKAGNPVEAAIAEAHRQIDQSIHRKKTEEERMGCW